MDHSPFKCSRKDLNLVKHTFKKREIQQGKPRNNSVKNATFFAAFKFGSTPYSLLPNAGKAFTALHKKNKIRERKERWHVLLYQLTEGGMCNP
jgi:hypothetical protein